MRINDTLSGLLLLMFGTTVAVYTRTFPAASGQGMGPGLFPMLIGCGLSLCGAALVWSGRRQPGPHWIEFEEWVRRPRLALNAALVVAALIFYALAVDTLGFFITAFVLLAVLMAAFGVSPKWIAPIAIVVTFGLHVAFYSLLRVPLPWGWLEPIAW